jgi:DNA-directed RNA polymerase specialized sigma24 family protein
MSQDERPEDEEGQDEVFAAFEALGGQLTWDELDRLLGFGKYQAVLTRQAALLVGGDTVAADEVVRASLAGLQEARSRLDNPGQARAWLYRAVVNNARSVRRYRDAPQAAPGEQARFRALLALPDRQREAVVLRNFMGLSEEQAAAAMSISTGAMRSHLRRGISSLPRRPR